MAERKMSQFLKEQRITSIERHQEILFGKKIKKQ